MRAMVLTDQTQPQCAAEHECPPGTVCPLGDCFAEGAEAPKEAVPVQIVRRKAAK